MKTILYKSTVGVTRFVYQHNFERNGQQSDMADVLTRLQANEFQNTSAQLGLTALETEVGRPTASARFNELKRQFESLEKQRLRIDGRVYRFKATKKRIHIYEQAGRYPKPGDIRITFIMRKNKLVMKKFRLREMPVHVHTGARYSSRHNRYDSYAGVIYHPHRIRDDYWDQYDREAYNRNSPEALEALEREAARYVAPFV